MELDQYWVNKVTQLPILFNITMDYIWLPISSCTVERSFFMYNSLLDSDRQNLSQDFLKRLNMIYFNILIETPMPETERRRSDPLVRGFFRF